MKNLNRKIYSQLDRQLDSKFFNEYYWQFERQLRSELGKQICSPLRRQFYWQINEKLKTQMEDGKFE
jgi:hypothetical protein